MSCKTNRQELITWLDNQLTPERSAELEAWFANCSSERHCTVCIKQMEEYRSLNAALSSLPKQELPAYVHYRIMDKLKQTEKKRSWQAAKYRWQAIPVAMAVLISLYFGSLVSNKTFSTSTATTAENSTENSLYSEVYSFGEHSLAEGLISEEVTP